MSFDAIKWAMGQKVGKSSTKFLLVAMANCVNEKESLDVCWPSVGHLCEATDLDRKTVLDGVRRLREFGLITDTGTRRGVTGQVIVYRLNLGQLAIHQETQNTPENGTVKGDSNTENGTVKESQNRDSSENGTVPFFPHNSTVFPIKESRFSHITVPKTGHGTKKEPRKETRKEPRTRGERAGSSFDALAMSLPDWLPVDIWATWVKDRIDRKKPVTEAGAKLQLRSLEKLRGEGHDPVLVIEHAIEKSWQGLYAGKDGSTRKVATGSAASSAGAVVGRHPIGSDEYLVDNRDAQWWRDAGFLNVWEAANARCWHNNAHKFRDGRVVPAEQEVHA